MSSAPITLLCSGFGLGFYIPGLLLRNRLAALGRSATAEVFECLLTDAALERVEKSRSAYRTNFAVALASQRTPVDIRPSVDPMRLESMLEQWNAERRQHFIALSGHWVHILDEYRRRFGRRLHSDVLYLDATPAPSWRQWKRLDPTYSQRHRDTVLYETSPAKVVRYVPTGLLPTPWQERDRRIVAHGGGWGLGDFESAVSAVEDAGYGVDVATYGDGAARGNADRRYLSDDPTWRVWHRGADGRLAFPPFGILDQGGWQQTSERQCHGIHRVIAGSHAILSKPGAGTLIDSFASETPVVMLTPFGPHEEQNAKVWAELGFGVSLEAWSSSGHSADLLASLHYNIRRARSATPDFATWYLESIGEVPDLCLTI